LAEERPREGCGSGKVRLQGRLEFIMRERILLAATSLIRRSSLLAALVLTLPLAPLAAGCGSDAASESSDITQAVSFEVLDVTHEAPKAGLTVLKNGADYHAFFGADAPDVDFNRYWVVHYSLGKKSHGGFATRITAVLKTGPSSHRTLVVHTVDESPGDDCASTSAVEYPQFAVRIKKQPSTPAEKAIAEAVVKSCSAFDCGALEDRASETCFPDDDDADWESCFKDSFRDLGDVRQQAKDCCNGSGSFMWCADFNNGDFTCPTNGGTCTDEHVGCYEGEVENEDLTCPQPNSHSIQLCCVPEN
jgi:hypothetical protein